MSEEKNITTHLIEFTGKECQKCKANKPHIERLEAELGVKVHEYEVWHNAENFELLKKHCANKCASIPFYMNLKNGKYICGLADYEKFKEWASE